MGDFKKIFLEFPSSFQAMGKNRVEYQSTWVRKEIRVYKNKIIILEKHKTKNYSGGVITSAFFENRNRLEKLCKKFINFFCTINRKKYKNLFFAFSMKKQEIKFEKIFL